MELAYLNASETARRLKVTGQRVRQWAADGTLPGVKAANGAWIFKREDIEAFRAARLAKRDEPELDARAHEIVQARRRCLMNAAFVKLGEISLAYAGTIRDPASLDDDGPDSLATIERELLERAEILGEAVDCVRMAAAAYEIAKALPRMRTADLETLSKAHRASTQAQAPDQLH